LIATPPGQLAFDFAIVTEAERRPHPPAGFADPPFARGTSEQPSAGSAVVLFVRHPRARRYVLRVLDDHTIRVTMPRWGSKREAAAFVERERRWIDKERQRLQAGRAQLSDAARPTSAFAEDTGRGPDARHRELVDRARRVLPARLNELAAQHGLSVARVSIRNQRWRWGSCSRNGHICLNWRLVTMPDAVRDYVIIHELMHLKRMDHSKRFWKLVAAACPDYQAARRYLRNHSFVLAAAVRR
jgi:predicted metal-dependent hydrolase